MVSLGLDRRPNGLGSELKRRAANDVLGLRDKLLSMVAQGAVDKHQLAQREVGVLYLACELFFSWCFSVMNLFWRSNNECIR